MIEDAIGSGKPPDIMVFPEAVLWLAIFGNGSAPSVNWTEVRRLVRFKALNGAKVLFTTHTQHVICQQCLRILQ